MLWLYYAILSVLSRTARFCVFARLSLFPIFLEICWKSSSDLWSFVFWFLFQTWQQTQANQNLVDSVERVWILPDTIKVNGDSLSFRGKTKGHTFQVYYKLQSEEEKEHFQALTDLYEIELGGKLSEPEGQRNFGGFDYQAYLKTQGFTKH